MWDVFLFDGQRFGQLASMEIGLDFCIPQRRRKVFQSIVSFSRQFEFSFLFLRWFSFRVSPSGRQEVRTSHGGFL
jgi:hypothetical protein